MLRPANQADQAAWDHFVATTPHTPILQSWGWGQFNEKLGSEVIRVLDLKGEKIVGVAQGILSRRRMGRFIYIPHGPVGSRSSAIALIGEFKKIAREKGVDYLRIEPHELKSDETVKYLRNLGLRPAPSFVQAEVGWILRLDKSEEELLSGMRKTTRYQIRQAQKLGVEVTSQIDPKKLDIFHHLMKETAARQGFSPQAKRYLTIQFENLSALGIEKLYLAIYQGKVLAAAIIASFGDTAAYLHGASVAGKIPATHLLQWQAIRDAQAEGRKVYDFWGIAPNDNPRHPWAGLTLFKQGFGGEPLPYVSAWDYPLSGRYFLIALLEKARKTIRRN